MTMDFAGAEIGGKMRYRLQRKEPFAIANVLGNHSMPVHTYRWRDVAVSDDRSSLEELIPDIRDSNYRIEDTQ